jgi:hypothetical protein
MASAPSFPRDESQEKQQNVISDLFINFPFTDLSPRASPSFTLQATNTSGTSAKMMSKIAWPRPHPCTGRKILQGCVSRKVAQFGFYEAINEGKTNFSSMSSRR